MSLINMESKNKYLIATDYNAETAGVPITQIISKEDFRKIKDIRLRGVNYKSLFTYEPNYIISNIDLTGETIYFKFENKIHKINSVTCRYEDNVYKISIGATVSGGKADFAYIFPRLFYNDVEAILDTYVFDDEIYLKYKNTTIPASRQIIPKLKFKLKNTRIDEIYFSIYDVDVIQPEALTSNNGPINSVVGVNLANNDDAYKVFDGTETSIVVGTTGEDKSCDLQHIYKFDTPTIVYKFGMFTEASENSPTKYKVFGSMDNSTFDELLDIDQELAIDNLDLEKRIETTKQKAYQYYKIQLLAGQTKNTDIKIKAYRLFIENPIENNAI